jgi:amino acid transporter
LIAIFLYSGWDSAAYVGEETRQKKAGQAAVTSVVILFLIYSLAIFAFQGVVSGDQLQANAANVLAFIAEKLAGSFWGKLMIIAVLGGTLASLLAAIVSASRIAFAMGRDRVLPSWLGRVHGRWATPFNATVLFGLLNVAFIWGVLEIGPIGTALSNIVSTLGLYAAIFYALTGAAALWYYRRVIFSNATNLILGGILPGIGVAFMLFIVIYSLATHVLTPVALGFGFGLAGLGIIAAFASRFLSRAPYFTQPPAASS